MSKLLSIDTLIQEVIAANPDNPYFTIENIILAGKTGEVAKLVDQIFIQSGLGSVKAGLTRSLYGINFAGTGNMIPINRDYTGLTFFTKPILNMQAENLRNNRILSQLLNTDANSVHRLIRCYLDPQIFRGPEGYAFTSPFVDNKSPFIPLLSNYLLNMSGWPDLDSQTFTSASGNWREEYSFVDGIVKDYRTWDATCSFKNLDGNIITNFFFYWIMYQASVAAVGDLYPYPLFNYANEIDYNTAIYRINLDVTKSRLTGIARTISFPLSCPIGVQFNFDNTEDQIRENDQVSVTFRCHGAEYNDDILIHEFNTATELLNPEFVGRDREANYILLPKSVYTIFNGLGVPRINPDTYEMEWWVTNKDYLDNKHLLESVISNSGRIVDLVEQVNQMNKRG